MADGILGGIGDFFLGGGKYADPNAINPQYGVPESDVRQAGINTLANVSALLLAAGQPMTGAQRAQLLAGVGPAFGGMQSDIFKASQARLMTAQQRTALREQQELAAIDERRKRDPEGLAREMNIDVGRVRNLPVKTLADIARSITIAQGSRTPEQRRIDQLNIQQAERKLREPTIFKVGNQAYRFDEEGNPVQIGPARDYGFGDTETPAVPPPGVGVQPPDAARPPGAPPVAGTQPAREQYKMATISPSLDYKRAFGWRGASNVALGKIRGLSETTDADTQAATKAVAAINTVNSRLMSDLSSEVPGKNLKATQERTQSLLPKAGQFFTSPAEAVNKYSEIREMLKSEMNDLLFIGSPSSGASESDRVKAGQAYRSLRRSYDNISVIIDNLTAPRRAVAAPSSARNAPTGRAASQREQALEWLQKNPDDPRASAIRQRLGVQ